MSKGRRGQQYPFGLTGCQFIAAIIVLGTVLVVGFVGLGLYRFIKDRIPTTPPETTEKRGGPTPRRKAKPKSAQDAKDIYLNLGNPSNAGENDTDNYLMAKPEYVLSYNCERGIANWAAWQVVASDLGDAERKDDFRPDPSIPKNCPRVTPSDYTRSGYDKGHLCPSADRTADAETNSATFFMTNMMPQTGDNNRGPWERLESYTRDLVKEGNDVYIYAGAYGEKERLKNKVSVPTNTWKVVVVLPQGASSDDVTTNTRVIAINIPNETGIMSTDWRKYRTSVKAIEQATGYNLLSNVKQDVQSAIESRVDNK